MRIVLICLALLAVAGCGDGNDDRPVATATATAVPPTATTTATAVPTLTATPPATASATATPSQTATNSATPTATESLLRLPALRAEPDAVAGGRIVDAEGRHVLLRGVNVNALAEYWPGNEFPTVFPFAEGDADLMAGIGWNCVRLLLSWSRVEPQPGVYDDGYLATVAEAVEILAARGIYSIIDLHQDAWGPTLAAPPTEVCPQGFEPAFGWDGAPGWATLDGGALRCAQAGVRELSPAVIASFASFWANAEGPGGVGIADRYAAMLGHVAQVLSPVPGVAGYDLMNEPNAFGDEQEAALSAFYGEWLAAIRAGESAAGSAPRLVFFEPSALWSLLGNGAPPDFARDRDVVYAPHLYLGGFDGGPVNPQNFANARQDAASFGGAPVLSGEWGADPRRASDPNDPYFLTHQHLQDEYLFSATLWTWRESCGDPHKQADFRAGREPYVWGEFDVDCATNTVTGLRTDLFAQLTRAYVRAASGQLLETRYDHVSGALSASGTAAASGAELLAFYPASRHGEPTVSTTGLADVRLTLALGDNLYISARHTGADWTLQAE